MTILQLILNHFILLKLSSLENYFPSMLNFSIWADSWNFSHLCCWAKAHISNKTKMTENLHRWHFKTASEQPRFLFLESKSQHQSPFSSSNLFAFFSSADVCWLDDQRLSSKILISPIVFDLWFGRGDEPGIDFHYFLFIVPLTTRLILLHFLQTWILSKILNSSRS